MLIDVVISAFFGVLSALGVGGGSLLILWLTLIRDFPFPVAKYLNLLFFLPPAIIGCITHIKQQRIPLVRIFAAAASSCTCAAVFSATSSSWDVTWVRKLFGVLLVISAIREFRFRADKSKQAAP